ncbi:RidA family protein [Pseudomonas sp.]|jgi:enamine deaminase RidA (YjgF/YER057c/UK114 family)|uniref:RidA family protein n=1 Tax=Pseudomonas sp. TaxID=306 RepID=UPI0028B07CEA|nr:RidA family protein [Pseudomonas sp.]
MSIQRFQSNVRLSHAVSYNGLVYLTGQVADDCSVDVGAQTAQVLARIDELLAEAGSDKSRILFAQVWLKHVVADFDAMNAVWEGWVPAGQTPARATVGADLADEEILVEIAVQAALAG